MPTNHQYIRELLLQLKTFREQAGMTPSDVEQQLILGPGWVTAFEMGQIDPSLDIVTALLTLYGKTLQDIQVQNATNVAHISRSIDAVQAGNDLIINFVYTQHEAQYRLVNATVSQFNEVILTLRNGLSRLSSTYDGDEASAVKSDSVAQAFLRAVQLWPHANPSDLWWFVVYRAYCDPYNHPSEHSRLNLTESWKRTGGWALERAFVDHYAPALAQQGVRMFIATNEERVRLTSGIQTGHRLEADKMDIMLTIPSPQGEKFIGVVHVKASFAERRTDDVPMSGALVNAGYLSPLLTMDCKSIPGPAPFNKGELGKAWPEKRSAKRKDIEDDGFFSACFSYNSNTIPTPNGYNAPGGQIVVCNLSNPHDAFFNYVVNEAQRFRTAPGI